MSAAKAYVHWPILASFFQQLTVWNGLLLAGGLALVVAGLIRLRHGRIGPIGSQSVPTVLAQGLALLVLGYHLMAWSVNATRRIEGLICMPAAWWWVLVLGLGVLMGVARAIDMAEAKQR